jgi:hypothetical protein
MLDCSPALPFPPVRAILNHECAYSVALCPVILAVLLFVVCRTVLSLTSDCPIIWKLTVSAGLENHPASFAQEVSAQLVEKLRMCSDSVASGQGWMLNPVLLEVLEPHLKSGAWPSPDETSCPCLAEMWLD